SRQAIGEPLSSMPVTTVLRGAVDQDPYVERGLPLGTQPGMLVEHQFPADGEYEFRVNGVAIVTLDGVKVPTAGRVAVKSGTHKVGLATAPRSYIESDAT